MRDPHPRIVLGLHRSRHERSVLTDALDAGIEAIDTSFNYRHFSAHSALANAGRDLLPRFSISTKVGFFAAYGRPVHSLCPRRLRAALELTCRDLERAPELVFLHNPERSLTGPSASARDRLRNACMTMYQAVTDGLCKTWGIASWDPRPLAALVDGTLPRPAVVMVRAGLLVGIDTMDATSAVVTRWGLDDRTRLWGMSPFGGNMAQDLWRRVDPRLFIRDAHDGVTRAQAAFRAAYSLPEVRAVAVGTHNPVHMRELLSALECEVNDVAVRRYRMLLRDRARRHPR